MNRFTTSMMNILMVLLSGYADGQRISEGSRPIYDGL